MISWQTNWTQCINVQQKIPYVLTCDGVVTKFHKSYSKQMGLSPKNEAYIQYIVLKKTLVSISFDYLRNGDEAILGTQESASVKSENGKEPDPVDTKQGDNKVGK